MENENSTTPQTRTIHYFALDGNYGNADGIVLVETDDFSVEEWLEIEEASDNERANMAVEIATRHDLTRYKK
jgi:hypothetical protein